MTRRTLVLGAVLAFLVFLGWDLLSGIAGGPASAPPEASISVATPEPTQSPLPHTDLHQGRAGASRISYAIAVKEIAGLSPVTPPGTLLDIWVTWDRPLTETPQLQRLLRRVSLEEIAAPVTPDGPYVALLSVSERDADELIWADRYGSLSATTAPS